MSPRRRSSARAAVPRSRADTGPCLESRAAKEISKSARDASASGSVRSGEISLPARALRGERDLPVRTPADDFPEFCFISGKSDIVRVTHGTGFIKKIISVFRGHLPDQCHMRASFSRVYEKRTADEPPAERCDDRDQVLL